ncbi:MAG: hypothetical protein ACJATW_002231 [Glaciecola sp.]|jgi:hypothetical protein
MAQIKQFQAAVSEAGSHFQSDKRLLVTQMMKLLLLRCLNFCAAKAMM